ncbi:nucleotidyltransferase domain-containing protein [Actinoplanes sp. DH11]|uniref:nucleotidyltransferase domain-containing protein n=1 Tax=Actinoplanes sp. DH11 TaxID=2857011 RepID=UPI001E2EEBD8|nr:aminoglycoside adenylyltransferase [Actinoplanes sp. DH11]
MNTDRIDGTTQRQLAAIAEVAAIGIPVWLRGGWAMDFFLGEVTRAHRDVDWFAWATDAPGITAALTGRGWQLLPEPPHDRQLDFVRDGVDLSLALVTTAGDDGTVVVAGGPWAGSAWPAGMLDWPAGRIGELRCAIVSPYAQIEIKRMMPAWAGLPRRPKDAEDVARLEAALAAPPHRPRGG